MIGREAHALSLQSAWGQQTTSQHGTYIQVQHDTGVSMCPYSKHAALQPGINLRTEMYTRHTSASGSSASAASRSAFLAAVAAALRSSTAELPDDDFQLSCCSFSDAAAREASSEST